MDFLSMLAPFFDMGAQAGSEMFNLGTRGAASIGYGSALDRVSGEVRDTAGWAGQYGMDQVNDATRANQASFDEYTRNRQDLLPFAQGLYGDARGRMEAGFEDEASGWRSIQNQAEQDRGNMDIRNRQMVQQAGENYKFVKDTYGQLREQGQRDIADITARADSAITDTTSRIDDAISTRQNTVGQQLKSINAQVDTQTAQAQSELEAMLYNGSMTNEQFNQAMRELKHNSYVAKGEGQIGLMASQNDAFVKDKIQGASIIAETKAQFSNIMASVRSSVLSADVSGLGITATEGGNYVSTLAKAFDNNLAASKFTADVNGNAMLAQERRNNLRASFDNGEITGLINAWTQDENADAMVEKWRQDLTSGAAADRANAATNLYSLLSSADQFLMAGESQRAAFISGVAVNPDMFSGFSEGLYNVQMLRNAGGGGAQDESGGFPWSGVGTAVGYGADVAMGGTGFEGMLEGQLIGSMFG